MGAGALTQGVVLVDASGALTGCGPIELPPRPSYRVNPSEAHKKSYEISLRPCCPACDASLAS